MLNVLAYIYGISHAYCRELKDNGGAILEHRLYVDAVCLCRACAHHCTTPFLNHNLSSTPSDGAEGGAHVIHVGASSVQDWHHSSVSWYIIACLRQR
jgi:hypothetical protein